MYLRFQIVIRFGNVHVSDNSLTHYEHDKISLQPLPQRYAKRITKNANQSVRRGTGRHFLFFFIIYFPNFIMLHTKHRTASHRATTTTTTATTFQKGPTYKKMPSHMPWLAGLHYRYKFNPTPAPQTDPNVCRSRGSGKAINLYAGARYSLVTSGYRHPD